MGLTPKVIASSNHLGNNDMKNINSAKAVSTAKLRVKHNIFKPWEEPQLDHKVSIMYTPYINDDKRDFVEYTSLGFLGQPHTMVTYTRASDSVLCVPLMIDVAVWCDYFAGRSWPYEKVGYVLFIYVDITCCCIGHTILVLPKLLFFLMLLSLSHSLNDLNYLKHFNHLNN